MDPDRRDHDETYRGHQLSVEAQREGARWGWWYRITPKGGGEVVSGQSATHAKVADAGVAIQRAINAARARADELKVATSPARAR
jgi:hypothetical protein